MRVNIVMYCEVLGSVRVSVYGLYAYISFNIGNCDKHTARLLSSHTNVVFPVVIVSNFRAYTFYNSIII